MSDKKKRWLEEKISSTLICPYCKGEYSTQNNKAEKFNYCPGCGRELEQPARKSIMVIDTPVDCNMCQFIRVGAVCRLTERESENVIEKPNWCPLKEITHMALEYEEPDDCSESYRDGYNACVDEIIGG